MKEHNKHPYVLTPEEVVERINKIVAEWNLDDDCEACYEKEEEQPQ